MIWSYGPQDIASGREVTQSRKFCNTFFENSFLSTRGRYRQALCMRGIWDIILQSCLNGLPQFLLNWYSFYAKTTQNIHFWPENSEHLLIVSVFYWYLIDFNLPKIYLDWMAGSKSQFFYHPWLGYLVLILVKSD